MREVQSTCLQLILRVILLADEGSLEVVMSEVESLNSNWQQLGVSLGIRSVDVKTILSKNHKSRSKNMGSMLTLWLSQQYEVNVGLGLFHLFLPFCQMQR